MKLSVEIEGSFITYNYEVGDSTSNGSSKICPESLDAFNLMLKLCHQHHCQRYKEWLNEINAKAYIEQHPELIKPTSEEK